MVCLIGYSQECRGILQITLQRQFHSTQGQCMSALDAAPKGRRCDASLLYHILVGFAGRPFHLLLRSGGVSFEDGEDIQQAADAGAVEKSVQPLL
jgi:hypothetical protein